MVVLIPLVVGIALTQYYTLPPFVAEIAICLLLVAAWFFDNRIASWGYTALALILLGYILVEYRSPSASVPYDSVVEMDVDVVGLPAERNGYSVAEGKVVRWREDGAWRRADDKVQLWLRTDTIGVGDRVVVWGELRELMEGNVSDYEMEKVKNKFEANMLMGEINVMNKAMNLGFYAMTGRLELINEESTLFRSITREEVMSFARERFTPNNSSTLIYRAK